MSQIQILHGLLYGGIAFVALFFVTCVILAIRWSIGAAKRAQLVQAFAVANPGAAATMPNRNLVYFDLSGRRVVGEYLRNAKRNGRGRKLLIQFDGNRVATRHKDAVEFVHTS